MSEDKNRLPAVHSRQIGIARSGERTYFGGMTILADNSPVMTKTKELCEAIAGDPDFRAAMVQVEAFLGDDSAKRQYQQVQEKSDHLHQKQHAGLDLSDGEVEDFEAAKKALFENSVAKAFIEAQSSLQNVQSAIGKYVGMTLELGRVPSEEDLADQSGCCSSGGCDCH